LGFRSAQAVHYQIEAMRHSYMDRNSYLGDPDFIKIHSTACSRKTTPRKSVG
jgi:gamma-glutamyltranspeptidase